MNFIRRNIKRLRYALFGIWYATRCDYSYRMQVLGGCVVLPIFLYFTWPLTQTELLFLFLAWALVLITELQNTSFEEALDHLHPELHDKIGRSKDMAAGAVLIAGAFLLFVMLIILSQRI